MLPAPERSMPAQRLTENQVHHSMSTAMLLPWANKWYSLHLQQEQVTLTATMPDLRSMSTVKSSNLLSHAKQLTDDRPNLRINQNSKLDNCPPRSATLRPNPSSKFGRRSKFHWVLQQAVNWARYVHYCCLAENKLPSGSHPASW